MKLIYIGIVIKNNKPLDFITHVVSFSFFSHLLFNFVFQIHPWTVQQTAKDTKYHWSYAVLINNTSGSTINISSPRSTLHYPSSPAIGVPLREPPVHQRE